MRRAPGCAWRCRTSWSTRRCARWPRTCARAQPDAAAGEAGGGAFPERAGDAWVYPSTAAQEGLLFHSLAAAGASVPYVSQFSCELHGALRPELLRAAVDLLVARHPALRASFPEAQRARHCQRIADRAALDWTVQEDAQGATREALLAAERRPFDLSRAPLVRVRLVRLGPERHLWIWTQHHLVADGQSQERLLGELSELFARLCAGEAVDVAEDPAYLQALLEIRRLQAQDSGFDWRGYLAHLEPPAAATLPVPLAPAEAPRELALALPAHEAAALGAACAAAQLTPATAMLCFFLLALAAGEGRRDLLAGLVLSGRGAAGPHHAAVGNLVNTLPVRATVNRGRTLTQWLAAMQARVAQLQRHDQVPLAEIRRRIGWPAAAPLFQALFVHEHYRAPEDLFGGGTGLRAEDSRFSVDEGYPLVLVCDTARGLHLTLRHQPDSVPDAAADRLLRRLDFAARAWPRHADTDVLAFFAQLAAQDDGAGQP